jgi:hypothetical protein
MAMPAHLEAWWREHPERWSERPRHAHGFPADGTTGRQIDWFRRQFLKLADKVGSTEDRRDALKLKHQGEFLKLAFMATLKGENARGPDDAMAQYHEFNRITERQMAKFEEGRARSEELLPKHDEEAILRHSQTAPYRTMDREEPHER